MNINCDICTGKADTKFRRVEVWSNERWRLTASSYKNVLGFCYLEPKRHIEHITDLDGQESQEFGFIMARITNALKKACQVKLVYVYIYGDHIPHLHIHLAPHTENDIFVHSVVIPERFDENEISSTTELELLKNNIQNNLV